MHYIEKLALIGMKTFGLYIEDRVFIKFDVIVFLKIVAKGDLAFFLDL